MVELVVEVSGFEDELLAEDVLIDAERVGAVALGGDGADVVGGDAGGVAGLLEACVEAGELSDEPWLLYAGGEVGVEDGAVEGLYGGTEGVVGQAEAGSSGDAEELVVDDGAAEGVEEALLDVALDLEGVEVVGALDDLVLLGSGIEEAAALVFVVEAEEGGDAPGESVVGLVVELVAIGDGVVCGENEGGLACGGVAVASAEGDDVSVVGGLGNAVDDGGDGLAGRGELLELFALAGDAVAGEVVPVASERVFDGEAGVDVLVGLLAGGGDGVDVVCAGEADGGGGVAEGEASEGVGEDGVTDVRDAVDGVVLVERKGVGGVEAAEAGEEVELAVNPGGDAFVAIRVEVAGVAGVVEDRAGIGAVGGGEIDDACFGSGALEGTVGSAVEFGAGEGDGGDGGVVEVAADVGRGDAIR